MRAFGPATTPPHHSQFHVTQQLYKPALRLPGCMLTVKLVIIGVGHHWYGHEIKQVYRRFSAFLHDLSNLACRKVQCQYFA